jgi:PAS domain S-box-containing protein
MPSTELSMQQARGWQDWFAGLRGGIAVRLLAYVLLFSSLVTLVLTSAQLYLDYAHGVGEIEMQLNSIERSSLGSLSESLWNLDQRQLALQLNGMMHLPSITAAEVREAVTGRDPLIVSVGQREPGTTIRREFPLLHDVSGQLQPIGVFSIEASLTNVYRSLFDRALVIMASQGAKTFLVSLFIIFIFHSLVTRHLTAIAEYVGHYDVGRPLPALGLRRRSPPEEDELDRVVAALNNQYVGLKSAYDAFRRANVELVNDNLARRRAEEALRRSEQRFRDYAETASDWLWETGPDHVFTSISGRLSDFDIDRRAAIGENRLSLAADPETEPEKWREHLAILDRHEPFRNFEYRLDDARGRRRHVSTSGRPVFDDDGRFVGYRGTSTDLTRQSEAEQLLRQSQKMDAIGQLTGGVAHDFNNILTVITGTIEILTEGLADKPQLAAVARMIDEAATRGSDLTSQLLSFARKQPLQPGDTDINSLIVTTAKLLRPTLGEHVEIDSMLEAECWHASVDASQLSTALINLAVNARDAMPGGGKITFATANATLGRSIAGTNIEVSPGDYVSIAVRDTGTGIPLAIRDKVFEPFFTTKAVGKGTGLGLSMVYGFIKQSGGHIKIDSEEGRGTTFSLYLPKSAQETGSINAAASNELRGGSETILVVEDDALVRGYVTAQLSTLGYKTIAAANGAEALALLDRGAAFDVLFTDVIMPGGMNGRELANAVAQRRPGLRVLYTSGYPQDAIIHHGRLDPGVLLLAKPYRKADLARMMRQVLGSRPESDAFVS